ncbi:MAG: hypothetical protein AB2A00_09285 [Myxococcota bacterium]
MNRLGRILALTTVLCAAVAKAAPPDSLTLQGVLREESGGLQDGQFDIRVRLLDGATEVFSETYVNVPVQSGVFSLEVRGTTTSIRETLIEHPNVLIEISVEGQVLSAQPLQSVPYALYCAHSDTAANASQLDGSPPSSWVQKADLADADPATSPVHWRSISSLPPDCPPGQFVTGFDSASGQAKCSAPPFAVADGGVAVGGGDVTAVLPGAGLVGGGSTGEITLSVDPTYVQRRISACNPGTALSSVAEDGNATCEPIPPPGISDVVAGLGLTGGGASNSITMDVDDAYVQRRVSQQCPAGTFFRGIAQDGSVTCGADSASPYTRTLVASPVTGDSAASGAALLTLLASVTDASATNRYLLKIEPGTYDLGTSPLVMKPYVDVEGAGEAATRLVRQGFASNIGGYPDSGTVIGSDNAELRSLTAENMGGAAYGAAIYNPGASPTIRQVAAIANGATTRTVGIYNFSSGSSLSSPLLKDVTVRVAAGGGSGYGIHSVGLAAQDSSPRLEGVSVFMTGATSNNYGVLTNMASATMSGTSVDISASTSNCYGLHVTASDLVVRGLIVSMAGCNENRGVWTNSSSVQLYAGHLTISGLKATGIRFDEASASVASRILDTTMSVTGTAGSDAVGVYVEPSTPATTITLSNVTLDVAGAPVNLSRGIFNDDSGTVVTVHRSTITGDPALEVSTSATVRAGSCQIAGAVSGAGTKTCVHAYSASMAALGTACN